jgi:hypothetical protein
MWIKSKGKDLEGALKKNKERGSAPLSSLCFGLISCLEFSVSQGFHWVLA